MAIAGGCSGECGGAGCLGGFFALEGGVDLLYSGMLGSGRAMAFS